ncbi:MAG: histidine phosphatase family protein [Ruminococcaceae bacterium]|nr:histidine phosphatase family protein [Oscillospiraceae bacterium]
MKTYKIHFIRHGLTEANADGRYIGRTDILLSSVGAAELESVKSEGFLPNVGLVFTSPLARCTESCEILYPGNAPYVIDEWAEYDFGDFEGKTAFELEKDPAYTEWTSGKRSAPPNGENGYDFTKRLCVGLNIAVRKMMELEVKEAAAVLHGGVIMSLLAATALPRRQMVEWTSDAGCGYTARITPSLYGRSGIIEIIDTVPTSFPEETDENEE